ncbi:VTT domain-containing protein [Allochromatium palmeri]|uniref:Phosphatidylserine/phosphatidylglycerophosphate/ cardiolipin synthase n=1 Tax=Allochromatium palmeri TaxID=231048 RepID=A0A6N8EEU1_9GAMM|nr:VTT domain-containing protein [Allochromatium palmeri]MTW21057.1 phosphatidylserine/phosphatidylglycerophosphate/cardiolipin synthase [Allochromatium palmeri]
MEDVLPATPSDRDRRPTFALEPGRNCWRVAHANRVAACVDGEGYFAALRRSLIGARRCIAISAWDLHSRVELVRGDAEETVGDDALPTALGALLIALLERHPDLSVSLLLWAHAPIYALERESAILGDGPWPDHPRLHLIMDNAHPALASQHQKLVLIDGRIAWCGGFDLSQWRWDTSAHVADDPRRRDPDGDPYPPYHDVQMLVDGEAALALLALFRERWQRAGGRLSDALRDVPDARRADPDPWPRGITPMLRDQPIGIARTLPEYAGHAEVRESERLYLDMIASARELLYVQNQYLTARTIADALCRSLAQPRGPRVVIILPRQTGHWLEQHTMDILRARILARLRDVDHHGRLRVYYPEVPGLGDDCMMVHSKLMIADDRVLRVGSSNLSNRSMGLDSECDLCIVADSTQARATIAGFRHRLIANFLSLEPDVVARAEQRAAQTGGGVTEAIEQLRAADANGPEPPAGSVQRHRRPRLVELDGRVDPEWDRQLPDARLIDPDRPLAPERVADIVVGQENTPHLRRRLLIGGGLLLLFLALAAAWRWTPLGAWMDPHLLAEAARGLGRSLWGPPLAVAGFSLAAVAGVPVTFLILVASLIFAPFTGALVAMAGSLLSALGGYGIGAYTARDSLERMAGGALERLSRRLAHRGILTVMTVRIVPVAPFAVLNLIAGASHVRLRDFLIGTFLGMTPAILAMAVFAEGLVALLGQASLRSLALVLVGLLALIGLAWLGRRMLRREQGA